LDVRGTACRLAGLVFVSATEWPTAAALALGKDPGAAYAAWAAR
jgi:hypothetical protein